MNAPSFLGLRTVKYAAPDLEKAKAWYARALGLRPYFDQPFYVGFNVGGFELGLDPNAATRGAGGVVAYWGVPDIAAAWEHLRAAGAKPVEQISDVGDGIKVAALEDPFGNLIGIIENPHFPNTAQP
jgi:catechol 2,3-dioxygenase-like lactoylglutathione lyase family enzyme